MRDSGEKGAGMRDQDPPFQTLVMTMGKEHILARVTGIQQVNRGQPRIFQRYLSNYDSKKAVKYRTMYGIFFPNLNSIISEKCVVTPNFLFGFQQPLLRSAFPV